MAKIASKDFYTAQEAASIVGCHERRVRVMAEQGRIPFVSKHGAIWSLSLRSIEFLKEYGIQSGRPGQDAAEQMRLAAAKLDPSCRDRQREYRPVPKPVRKTKSKRKPVA